MNRRQIFTFLIALAGAILALAFFQGGYRLPFARLLYDISLFGTAMAVIGRLRPARTVKREIYRFEVGILLHLLFSLLLSGVLLLIAFQTIQPVDESWLLLLRIPFAFTLAWSIWSLIRMGGMRNWGKRRRAILVFSTLSLIVIGANAPAAVLTIFAIIFALFIQPWNWVESLSRRSGWVIFGLFILAPVGFVVYLGGISGNETEGLNISVSSAGAAEAMLGSNFFELISNIIAFTWLAVPLKLTVSLFQGMFGIRLPIWLKFGSTYVFSTIIPGMMLILVIFVGVYVGIGSSRAKIVRDMIHNDMRSLETALAMDQLRGYAEEDSIAVATYRRVFPSAQDQQDIPPPPSPFGSTEPGREWPNPEDYGATSSEPWDQYAELDTKMGETGLLELWVKQDDTLGQWALPDTLTPFPGWTFANTASHGILPIAPDRAAYAAAVVSPDDPVVLQVAMEPLNAAVLEPYKEMVHSDVTLNPLGIIHVGRDESGLSNRISGETFEGQTDIEISTRHRSTADIWHRPIIHGWCELESWPGLGNSATMLGQVYVHTTLAGLFSNLYAWEGLNRFTAIGLIVLLSLFALAMLFSSLLAGGITRTVMRSVKELRQGTERLRKGDLDVKLAVRGNDELSDLALSFNQMTSDLRRMISEVTVKERLEREIQIARRIQIHLLPTELPQRPTLQVGAHSDPAFEVGGDYYDCIDLGERGLLVVLGDVSGKGVGAAVLMSNLQASLSLLATQNLPLRELVRQLNVQVCKNSTPEMFITFFAALFNPEKGTMTYVNAGHDIPFLIRYGKPISLELGGMLLGIMEDGDYIETEVKIEPGDLFAAYSDGLTEAMNATDVEFGRDRLIKTMDEFKHLDPHLLVTKVLQTIRDYAGHERAGQDDLTLITVKVTEK